jgi:hypothetical protein
VRRSSRVWRANVILYVDVAHRMIIGERADAAVTARRVPATGLQHLG